MSSGSARGTIFVDRYFTDGGRYKRTLLTVLTGGGGGGYNR